MLGKMLGIGLALIAAATVTADEPEMQTLMGGKVAHGGFGGPVVKFTRANDKLAVMTGGRGAWIINHRLTLGGGGYGIVNRIALPYADPDTGRYLQMGYGGVEIGYIVRPEKLVNVWASLLIGGGSAMQRYEARNRDWDGGDHGMGYPNSGYDAFVVIEPAVTAGLNVTKFMRLTAGLGYRYVNGMDVGWISDKDLRDFEGSLGVMFGRF